MNDKIRLIEKKIKEHRQNKIESNILNDVTFRKVLFSLTQDIYNMKFSDIQDRKRILDMINDIWIYGDKRKCYQYLGSIDI